MENFNAIAKPKGRNKQEFINWLAGAGFREPNFIGRSLHGPAVRIVA